MSWNQNTARHMVNEFLKCLFNATVYMEFQVCFSFAKYEKDRLSFCETGCLFVRQPNVVIDFFLFQNPFTSVGPFKLIKTLLKSLHVL